MSKEQLKAFYEYQDKLFWSKDIDSLDKRIDMWLESDECKALNIAGVVFSEERADVCQSFVVDTTTSSATICANCKKEAWEHGQT